MKIIYPAEYLTFIMAFASYLALVSSFWLVLSSLE